MNSGCHVDGGKVENVSKARRHREKQQWLIKTFTMKIAGNIKSLYVFFSRSSSLSG